MEIALYEPEIPPNTGNIARLCVCAGVALHIIGRPSFFLDERSVRRAGLDYWERLRLFRHQGWDAFLADADSRLARQGGEGDVLLVSKHGATVYWDRQFRKHDILVFGSETQGLPERIHAAIRARGEGRILRIPMMEGERSLNLANAAALVLYEGLRQIGFPG